MLNLLPDEYMLRVDGDPDPAPAGDPPAGGGADPVVADPKDVKPEGDAPKAEGDEPKPGEGEPDAQEQTVAQLAEARAEKLVAERLEAAAAERATEEATAKAVARAEETGRLISTHKTKAAADIVAALKDVRVVENGQAVALTDALIDSKVFAPMNEMLSAIESSYQAEAADEFVGAAIDLVPDEGREAFLKATADTNLSAAEWLMATAEALAPKTKWAQKAALTHADAVATAKAEGFDAGKAAKTVAQPTQQDGNHRSPLTRAGFLSMSVEEQAKAYAERPDEVNALT